MPLCGSYHRQSFCCLKAAEYQPLREQCGADSHNSPSEVWARKRLHSGELQRSIVEKVQRTRRGDAVDKHH